MARSLHAQLFETFGQAITFDQHGTTVVYYPAEDKTGDGETIPAVVFKEERSTEETEFGRQVLYRRTVTIQRGAAPVKLTDEMIVEGERYAVDGLGDPEAEYLDVELVRYALMDRSQPGYRGYRG